MNEPRPTLSARRGTVLAVVAVLGLGGGLAAAWLLSRDPAAPRAVGVVEEASSAEPPRLAGRDARAATVADEDPPAGAGSADPASDPLAEEASGVAAQVRTIPFTVRILDPETGAPVPAQWSLRSWVDGPRRLARSRTLLPPLPDAVTALRFRAFGEPGFREIPAPGRFADAVVVRLPHDRVYLERTLLGVLAADATSASAAIPAWHEVPLEVLVLDEAGRPIPGSQVVDLLVAGSGLAVRVEAAGSGLHRLRGIPHLPGEPVEISVRSPAMNVSSGASSESDDAEVDLRTRKARTTIPTDRAAPWELTVVLLPGEPTGPSFSDHIETDNDLPAERAGGKPPDDGKGPRGSIRVRLLGPQGRPIVGAVPVLGGVAALAPTDADGNTRFERVPPGDDRVTAELEGRFPMSKTVTIRDGATTEVTIREPLGATIDLIVVDAHDRPLPFADFYVQGGLVFDVRDGDQRLDAYTDEQGRRTLARVEPGRLTVTASWASRSGTTTFTARDGERRAVYLVVE